MNTLYIRCLLALFIFTTSTQVHAEFKPLLGSDWARQNPGLLPYSKCAFVQDVSGAGFHTNSRKDGITTEELAILLGGIRPAQYDDRDIRLNTWVLGCVSEEHQLAFMIPIKLSTIYFLPALVFSFQGQAWLRFQSKTLDGKTVADLLHCFSGAGGAIGTMIAGGIYGYSNIKGINFSLSEITVPLVDVKLGYSWTSFKKIKNIKTDYRFSSNDAGIWGITSTTVNQSGGAQLVRQRPSLIERNLRVLDWPELKKLKFVRDTVKASNK